MTRLTRLDQVNNTHQSSDYKPHVRCWVYRTVPAHGDRCPFSTGTTRRSRRLSFFSSDKKLRKRNATLVIKYKNENRLRQQLWIIQLGGTGRNHEKNRWDTIYGRWRPLYVISNVTFRKQRTAVLRHNGMVSVAVNRNKWAHDTVRRKPLKTFFHNRAYAAAARVAVKRFLSVIGCHVGIPVWPAAMVDSPTAVWPMSFLIILLIMCVWPRPRGSQACGVERKM